MVFENAHFMGLCLSISFIQEGNTRFAFPTQKSYSLSGFNLCPQKNESDESKEHKNTPNSRTESLKHIAILHTDLLYMKGGKFYLVHLLR